MKYFETDICVWSVSWADHQLSCPPDRFPAVSGSGLPDLRQNKPKFRLVQQGRAGQRKGEQWGLTVRARRRLSCSPRSSLRSPICSTRFQLRFVVEAALEQSVSAAPIRLRIRLRKQDHPSQRSWKTNGEAVEEPEIWQGELSSPFPRTKVRYTSFSTNTLLPVRSLQHSTGWRRNESEFHLYLNARASWSERRYEENFTLLMYE